MAKSTKRLSASRIKTLENCSWTYWCKYHLKLPDESNSGALKGTICHAVFEWLLQKKHEKHFQRIVAANDIQGSPAIDRIVKAFLKTNGLHDKKEYEMVNNMIVVGLTNDFFVTGKKVFDPEYEFLIENEEPKYSAMGYIDKWAKDVKKKEVHVIDYKSSKSKFSGEDLESNVQAMLYSLAAKKVYPDYVPIVTFVFLQFAKSPNQVLQFDETTLNGFEHYLEMCQNKIEEFSYTDAVSNFAADTKPKGGGFNGYLLCGFAKEPGELKKDGTPKWHCPFRFKFDYYTLLDANNNVVKSVKVNDIVAQYRDKFPPELEAEKAKHDGWKIEMRNYGGCPRWNKTTLTSF